MKVKSEKRKVISRGIYHFSLIPFSILPFTNVKTLDYLIDSQAFLISAPPSVFSIIFFQIFKVILGNLRHP
jgi:hypothetical protein